MKHQLSQRVLALPGNARLELFSMGEGPGIVVVHGAMVTIHQYLGLIHRLHAFTGMPVHFYHRRGRGSSSAQPENYSLRTEIEDAEAVVRATGSRILLGHSFGGAVALHAARAMGPDLLDGVITYDAAANVGGSFPTGYLPEANAALSYGRLALATAIAGKNLGTVPFLPRLPLPVLARMIQTAARTSAGAQLEYLAAPTLRELEQLRQSDRPADQYGLSVPTLLLVGARSPRFFRRASEEIAEATNATVRVLLGLHHDGGTRGPLPVIREVAEFCRATGVETAPCRPSRRRSAAAAARSGVGIRSGIPRPKARRRPEPPAEETPGA
ncbi:alpha/beta hydrolase [Falsarthrobacter nasiphocae]|uniref:Pimeloyl-ACP methyl ester carboxylesterase n=1 Tax=Falsarthrobacter nasiphocae TaxID=189863 RepID=A0AAE3YEX9_9MICC|nr:alpha/beta hydrolase [Falsarthrobacter nasiphocae]MDR6891975.1 pimeloyl-ACP methyl ester carboxylesterase [Falsarthrobacter nasiphocae]